MEWHGCVLVLELAGCLILFAPAVIGHTAVAMGGPHSKEKQAPPKTIPRRSEATHPRMPQA